jgi:hypothetical protein
MYVAGPTSRQLLQRVVTGVVQSPDAFPYMNVRTSRVAGVDDCVLWRIGFTGELSYRNVGQCAALQGGGEGPPGTGVPSAGVGVFTLAGFAAGCTGGAC